MNKDRLKADERLRKEIEEKELEWVRLHRDKQQQQHKQQRDREAELRLQPDKVRERVACGHVSI